jgi:lysine-N-methylase
LSNSFPIQPKYAESFRCIGSDCEDTCCAGWSVPIDAATWDKYQNLPQSPLRVLMDSSIDHASKPACNHQDAPAEAATVNDPTFATIRMDSANQCPLLTEERLCRIQIELGEGLLSHTCATYPRIFLSVGGAQEKALSLSCPEAARLVLLTPDLLPDARDLERQASGAGQAAEKFAPPSIHDGSESGHDFSRAAYAARSPGALAPEGSSDESRHNFSQTFAASESANALPPHFWPIRSAVLNVVRNRNYPLWQRLFLLDLLCRRLDSIARGELQSTVPKLLADFDATVTTGSLRPAMDALPSDRNAQLDVVLRLAGMMLHKSNVRPRFVECVQAFTVGIGNGPGATLESLAAHYAFAHDRSFAPFFDRHPHILENFLINTILRCQFPFGKEGMRTGAQPGKAREFALLAAQFALMRGLLIGVAGHHGAAFSAAHVVHTVQAASKHFEHHPEFLSLAHSLLVDSRIDGAQGLAILLRDPTTDRVGVDRGAGEAMPAAAAIYAAVPPGGRSASAPGPAGTVRPE